MNYDMSVYFALCIGAFLIMVALFGCADQDRFVKRLCLDMNGNEMECVHD